MKRKLWRIPAVIAGLLIITCLYKLVFVKWADMVIKYDFTGLENLFHADHEYYAVIGSTATYVPWSLVNIFYPDLDPEQDIYEDENNNYYYTSIQYSPEGNFNIKTPLIDLDKGDQFAATYREWTRNTDPMTEEMKGFIKGIILDNYDFDDFFVDEDDGWVWRTGNTYGLDGFILVAPKGVADRAVLDSDDKVSVVKGGKLRKIMNCPKNGRCGFVYFTDF